jgi:hypothetical protein
MYPKCQIYQNIKQKFFLIHHIKSRGHPIIMHKVKNVLHGQFAAKTEDYCEEGDWIISHAGSNDIG